MKLPKKKASKDSVMVSGRAHRDDVEKLQKANVNISELIREQIKQAAKQV